MDLDPETYPELYAFLLPCNLTHYERQRELRQLIREKQAEVLHEIRRRLDKVGSCPQTGHIWGVEVGWFNEVLRETETALREGRDE